ncbi:MAG: lysine--tRNA ligase, partial [Rhodobacteraceae bacterium]|nr:lysine--tRNA ligase [Paracoccaceae bacterium]
LRAYETQDEKARLNNPVWHIHGGTPPKSDMVVPFTMLLNLASASSAENTDTMWGFINKYAPEASPESNPTMQAAAQRAVRYFQDFVKPTKQFRAPDDQERAALSDLAAALKDAALAKSMVEKKNAAMGKDEPVADLDMTSPEDLQSVVFAVGKNHSFENLRDWFTAIYEVLLGTSQGPRFGGFIAVYGVKDTVALIEKGLAGELT